MAHSERLKKAIKTLEQVQEDFTFLEIALRLLQAPDSEPVTKIKEASFLLNRFINKENTLKKLESAIDELDIVLRLYNTGRRD